MENPGDIAVLTSSYGEHKVISKMPVHNQGEGRPETVLLHGIVAKIQTNWVNQGISSIEWV